MTKFIPKRGQDYWQLKLINGRFKLEKTANTGNKEDKAVIKSGLIAATKRELTPVAQDLNKILHNFAKGTAKKGDSKLNYL